jgi:hypothetical protein
LGKEDESLHIVFAVSLTVSTVTARGPRGAHSDQGALLQRAVAVLVEPRISGSGHGEAEREFAVLVFKLQSVVKRFRCCAVPPIST